MKQVCRIFLIFIGLAYLSGCFFQTKPLTISTNTWIGYEPLYVIEQLQLIDEPLTLLRKKNATDVMSAFEKGEADVACLTLDEAMMLLAKGVDLYFISVMDISDGADQLLVNKEITKLGQLKNKSIGVETTALGRLILSNVLQEANLLASDVNIVNSTVDKHHDMFLKGAIDAAITFPPFSESLIKKGMHKLYDSSQMKKAPIIDVMVATKEAIELKKDALVKLLESLYEVNKRILEQDRNVIEIIGKNLNIEASQWPYLTDGVKLVTPEVNDIYINRYKLEATMIILEEVMLKNQLLQAPMSENINIEMFIRL